MFMKQLLFVIFIFSSNLLFSQNNTPVLSNGSKAAEIKNQLDIKPEIKKAEVAEVKVSDKKENTNPQPKIESTPALMNSNKKEN